MRVLATITDPSVVKKILSHLGVRYVCISAGYGRARRDASVEERERATPWG